ncbi:MAG: hypothetical protein IIW08_08020 [Clostridia bacterium]|nr:hypothetical protein [Clostridia bacterium]
MPFIVSKFGGTSLCSGEMFLRVRDIVRENGERKIIVVSAPGKRFSSDMKVTDILINLSENKSERLFSLLKDRFLSVADALEIDIDSKLAQIKKLVFSGADRAEIVSRGEWLSAYIMARLLGFHFLDAKDAIRFSGNEIAKITFQNIQSAYKKHGNIVLPGFYGADESGNIRLFPRGGSDISGAIAAKAVGARLYENWTDVNGVFDKDPAKYTDAELLSEMSFSDMRRLSESGACVLHPDSLLPVMEAGICVRVRNTFRPEEKGTLIHE